MPRRGKRSPDHESALATLLGVSPATLKEWLDAAAKAPARAARPKRRTAKRKRRRRGR
jgi:DNA-binding transcriptional regulator YdaS (Cro superfamily)